MPQAVLDHIDTIDSEELHGVIVSVTRLARVTGLVINPAAPYSALWDALNSSTGAAPMPQYGDTLATGLSPGVQSPYSGLRLARRSVKIVDKDIGTYDVTLKYEHLLDGANQDLQVPKSGILYTKGKCSVREKPTNFYTPYGAAVGAIVNGVPVTKTRLLVANQYPVGTEQAEFSGRYLEQLGEIKVPFPECNAQLQGTCIVVDPVAFAYKFIARINVNTFMGRPPLTWLCSEVSWQVLRPDTGLYQFGFEFQNDPDTWNRDIAFLDPRTNLPPSSVLFANVADQYGIMSLTVNPLPGADVIPAGAWSVPYLARIDFAMEFGAVFK